MLGFLKKKRSVVLVLGGGSARGLAHIGVLKVLEKEKIPTCPAERYACVLSRSRKLAAA